VDATGAGVSLGVTASITRPTAANLFQTPPLGVLGDLLRVKVGVVGGGVEGGARSSVDFEALVGVLGRTGGFSSAFFLSRRPIFGIERGDKIRDSL
jgi:hypothetical protein